MKADEGTATIIERADHEVSTPQIVKPIDPKEFDVFRDSPTNRKPIPTFVVTESGLRYPHVKDFKFPVQEDPYERHDIPDYNEEVRPKQLSDSRLERILAYASKIKYGEIYVDDSDIEFRQVTLPEELFRLLPKDYFEEYRYGGVIRVLREDEWRCLGIKQGLGWEHIEGYEPNPRVLIFKKYPFPLDKEM